jgi:D-glycero-D-manno-heptose 1,7-bisphosphate phosphatase
VTAQHPGVQLPTVAFLDRDGTIIVDAEYASRPEEVELLPGAAEAIARLNRAGIPVILVTNQSGIGRGYFTTDDYARVHARLVELLSAHGARLDGAYMCPHRPDLEPPCPCRKPRAGLFLQAIHEHQLDSSRPVFIGDRWRDLAAADVLGGLRILTPSPSTTNDDRAQAQNHAIVLPSLAAAVAGIFEGTLGNV